MLLCVDIGNTNIKIGVFDGDQLVQRWRLATERERLADEYAVLVSSLFSAADLHINQITGCAISSVVPSLTDTFDAVQLAQRNGMDTVMSHRSGETTDTTIAHLATAFSCVFLKCGVVGGERIAKLNELIRIEEQL